MLNEIANMILFTLEKIARGLLYINVLGWPIAYVIYWIKTIHKEQKERKIKGKIIRNSDLYLMLLLVSFYAVVKAAQGFPENWNALFLTAGKAALMLSITCIWGRSKEKLITRKNK